MKQQVLGTFFYMLYLVAMLQPIIPLIEYYSNKEYIASVLCENRNRPELACNGKCYLEKKLAKSTNHSSHNHSIPKIDLSKYPVAPINNNLSVKKNTSSKNIKNPIFYKLQIHSQKYTSSVFKPPQILV